jgi:tRNA A-37 threonylcarbamoyl transferase component Bud32/tetratricopeptide (TPR) repeat protein
MIDPANPSSGRDVRPEVPGRFELIRRLGAGSTGVVYEAVDREKGSRVALKSLRQPSAEAVIRFKQEFRALQDITHPNLVSLGELFEERGQWFFTMELVEGMTFIEWVRPRARTIEDSAEAELMDTLTMLPTRTAERTYDEMRLRDALGQLAGGVTALHRAGKVHRDVKPSNALVSDAGRLVLLDFGLVTDTRESEESQGDVVGTAAYMAPEQAAGRAIGPEADWYAVGVVLYQALTGRLPIEGATVQALTERKQWCDPTPPHRLVSGIQGDLEQLCLELLRFDPKARPTGPAVLARLGIRETSGLTGTPAYSTATQLAPFIGRRDEMEFLRRAFEDTRAGTPVTVCIQGESGVGKTALARQFGEAVASHERVVVLSGRCYERETVPYKAVDAVVDALSRFMQRLPMEQAAVFVPRRAHLLLQMFPVLRRVESMARLPRTEPQIVDPQELRAQVFAAFRELLGRVAEWHVLVVAIDDLQWADADSMALLAELLRPPDAPPILVIATSRTPLDGLPGQVRNLHLRRLSQADACELAALLMERIGGTGATAAGAETIAKETGGHPLFIDLLVRHLGGRAAPAAQGRLEDVLWHRIQQLDPTARRTLELAAVAGTPVPQEVVARAAQVGLEAFARLVALLRVSHLVRTSGAHGTDFVEPYHDRVRDAVVSHLSPEGRRDHHRDLARAMEASSRADPEALAIHFHGAGDDEQAARHAATAAHQAAEALAFDRAVRLFRLALTLGPREGARGLRVRLGDALASAGRGAEAAQEYTGAVEGATAAEALDLQRRAAQQLLASGHIDEGIAALRQVLASEGLRLPGSPPSALLDLIVERTRLRLRGMRFKTRDVTEVAGHQLARIDICWFVGMGLATVDHVRGSAFQARGLRLALKAGEPYRLLRALALEGGYQASQGGRREERAAAYFKTATQLLDRVTHPHAVPWMLGTQGTAAFLLGRFRKALELCTEAERLFRERCVGVPWEVATMRLWSSRALWYLGRLADLADRVPLLMRESRERGDLYGEISLRASVAPLMEVAAGRPDQALEEARVAEAAWSTKAFHIQHYYALFSRLSALLYAGRINEATADLRRTWPPLRWSLILRVQVIRANMIDLRGRAALAAGDLAGTERAALGLAREKMPWIDALSLMLRAGLEAARGRTAAAVKLYEEAAAAFDATDMSLHAQAADRRRGALIGGDEGRVLVDAADAWMRGQRIADPERITDMLAPR